LKYPIRHLIYEKISKAGAMTDSEIYAALIRDGVQLSEGQFNKILLDLDIWGLIRVTWLTKDKRRVELAPVRKY
jgi:hypothetical protein